MLLFWLAAGFIAGILLGSIVSLSAAWLFAGVAILLCAAWLARGLPGPVLLLVLAAGLSGMARAPHPTAPVPGELAYYNGAAVQLQGRVSEEPDIRDTGANYVISIDQILVHGSSKHVSGKITIHTSRAVALDFGDVVRVTGRLLTPHNSASVPYRDILAQRGIGSEMRFPRLTDLGPGAGGWLDWVVPLRQRLERGIDGWLPEPEAALLIAITLGARSASLGDITPALISTGLIHLIAISGIKVAMVAGLVHRLVRSAGNRAITLAASLGVIWLYVILTGATPSGVRSAIMWALVFIATYFGRGTVALVSLGFAAAVMVALEPTLLSNIGFQLSVVGTLAIVAFTERIESRLPLPSPFRQAAAVTLAAQVGTLPIVVFGFHVVSLTGPVANAMVLPLVPVLIVLGFLVGGLAQYPALSAPLGALAHAILHAVVILVERLASVPGALPVSSLSTPSTIVYYGLGAAVAVMLLRHAHWRPLVMREDPRHGLALTVILGASVLTTSLVSGQSPPRARLDWMGTGNALLLRSGGMAALIDGSPHTLTLLERLGSALSFRTRTIDVVVVTRPDAQNLATLTSILERYQVSEVLDVGEEYPSSTYARWRAALRRRRIGVYALRTGAEVRLGDATIRALGPDGVCAVPRNCAGMLAVALPHQQVLLAETTSSEEQFESTFRPVSLRADTLVCGSAGCNADFVHAVRARHLLLAGRDLPSASSISVAGG